MTVREPLDQAELDAKMKMLFDIGLQVLIVLVVAIVYLFVNDIPRKLRNRIAARRDRPRNQAKRHFVRGAQLYAQARSPSMSSRSQSKTLAKQAEEEADRAITLDPTDAASHILKGLSLDLQGFKSSALNSFDFALSPLASASLTPAERADALVRRAELLMFGKGKGEAVDAAIGDLTRAVELCPSNVGALCLLGECYEVKMMKEKAKEAYQTALMADPDAAKAKDALSRLA